MLWLKIACPDCHSLILMLFLLPYPWMNECWLHSGGAVCSKQPAPAYLQSHSENVSVPNELFHEMDVHLGMEKCSAKKAAPRPDARKQQPDPPPQNWLPPSSDPSLRLRRLLAQENNGGGEEWKKLILKQRDLGTECVKHSEDSQWSMLSALPNNCQEVVNTTESAHGDSNRAMG